VVNSSVMWGSSSTTRIRSFSGTPPFSQTAPLGAPRQPR
jgi:hypothetical protein